MDGEKTVNVRYNGTTRAMTIWGLVVQTIILLCAMLGVWRGMDLRITQLDSHYLNTMTKLEHHIEDHFDRDLSRLRLHNGCNGAMNKGCHDQGIKRRE